jgi:hypothetical protein
MLRDCDIIYNKVRGLRVELRGFIEFGNYFSTVKSVDLDHGSMAQWRFTGAWCARCYESPAFTDDGWGG